MVKIGIGGKADIQKIHRLAQSGEVLVGYPDGVAHPDTALQNSDLARTLHHGTAKIPARPFLYLSIQSVRTELMKKIKTLNEKMIRENREPTGEFSLEGIGAFLVGAVNDFVRGDYFKNVTPNAPSTQEAKNGDTPLIDTGFMIQSTTFVTRKHPAKTRKSAIEVQG